MCIFSLRHLLVIVLLLLGFGIGVAQTCPNESSTPVTQQKGRGLTQDEAKRDAERTAIKYAYGSFIESQALVVNFQLVGEQIAERTVGFVQATTITSEEEKDGLYRVTIDTCVSKDLEWLKGELRVYRGHLA